MPMLTVLIPTYNGSDTIGRTLAALAELLPPRGGWKVVIVNNGSTDDTEKLILEWKHRLPLDYLVEPRRGRAAALNAGMARFDGDFLVVTDDDVLPDRDWLVEWRRVANAHPEYTVFGGAIEPEFEVPPARWVQPAWQVALYAATPPGRPEGPMAPADILGPNMAFRRSVIAQGARFEEWLGVGQDNLMGEETEFGQRLAAAGHKAWFAPKPRIRHIIWKSQTSVRWILHRFVRHGRTMYLWHLRDRQTAEAELFHMPRWAIRHLAESLLGLPLAALNCDESRFFSLLRSIAYDYGTLCQARKTARRGSPWQAESRGVLVEKF
jgi:L-malate glycosyltransferase